VDCMVEETLKVYRELLGRSPARLAKEHHTSPRARQAAIHPVPTAPQLKLQS